MNNDKYQNTQFSRTAMLLGDNAVDIIRQSKVAVFGLGGVGGYVVEALARCGIGTLDITDKDTVDVSNINRQIFATHSTVGQYKTDVAKARILDILPDANVITHTVFVTPDNIDDWDFAQFDCVVDAIDNVTAKLAIIERCNQSKTPVISSMGTGNRTNPFLFVIKDVYDTSYCPLARVMRRELKKRGIDKLTVLTSDEQALKPQNCCPDTRKAIPASIAYVPSVAGLSIASWVIQQIVSKSKN